MGNFRSPKIIFGHNAVKMLPHEIEGIGNKAVLIAGRTTSQLSARLIDALYQYGLTVSVWDKVEPDPFIETAISAYKFLDEIKPQLVIGFGGGSAIDVAKAAWVFYEKPELASTKNIGKAINPKIKLHLRKKARFMAVPTTSGSGSEVSWAFVLTDKDQQRKLGVANNEIVPDIALLIPELTLSMPKKLTAATGMDVLGHAFDGFTAIQQTDFSDGLCIQAIQMVFDWLPKVCKNGDDILAREKMQNAAALAGLGFGNSNTSLSHALAHAIGVEFCISHGSAVGLSLPYSLKYITSNPVVPNTPDPVKKLALIARIVGIDETSELDAIDKLILKIKTLMKEICESLTLREAGVSEQDFTSKLDLIANKASRDVNIYSIPCECKEADLKKILINMMG